MVGFGAVGLLFWKGWMVGSILRGLLCCERNDAVKEFLLLAVVYAKEGKEEERLGWIGVGRGRKVGFYRNGHFMDCVGRLVLVVCGKEVFFCGLYVCGWGFQSLWIGKGEREMGIAEDERLIAVSSAWEARELVYWDLKFLNTEGERARRSGFGISFSALSLQSLRPLAKDCRP